MPCFYLELRNDTFLELSENLSQSIRINVASSDRNLRLKIMNLKAEGLRKAPKLPSETTGTFQFSEFRYDTIYI